MSSIGLVDFIFVLPTAKYIYQIPVTLRNTQHTTPNLHIQIHSLQQLPQTHEQNHHPKNDAHTPHNIPHCENALRCTIHTDNYPRVKSRPPSAISTTRM
ncbi:hypothetical protein BDV24DRAFT_124577 [Aspergillus arachidicola]|uniref:Uncharacterized protein n=1 Tax=Aspergillus arachidicola TaxID=656916 RepID=A0A5N6YK12_9EURO|nr:hypothetical protein BDV24DRAFT_124577 [Aspergillus arachidicola]